MAPISAAILAAFIFLSANPISVGALSECLNLNDPLNGKFSCTKDGEKTVCVATCDPGYKFSNPDFGDEVRSVCDPSDGAWNPPCEDIFCKKEETSLCDALSPEDGKSECTEHKGELMCSIQCDDGFRIHSARIYVCDMDSGIWSPELPEKSKFPDCLIGSKKCPNLVSRTPDKLVMSCKIEERQHRCYPECRGGLTVTGDVPDNKYYTCLDGEWSPPYGTLTCEGVVDEQDPTGIAHITGIYTQKDVPVEQTGYCTTWGQQHYRTFDGKVYRFHGKTDFILAKDKLGDFTVLIHNDKDCSGLNCKRSATVKIGSIMIEMKEDPKLCEPAAYHDGEKLALPKSIHGVVIQRIADYIVVRDRISDLYVKWDGKESVSIRVNKEMLESTSGLCGFYNEDHTDDFKLPDGTVVKTVDKFAKGWLTDLDDPVKPHSSSFCVTDTDEGKTLTAKAIVSCTYLMDTPCRTLVDPTPFFEACKEDVCMCSNDDCVCNSMAAYFRECNRMGVFIDWREKGRCSLTCPGSMVYDACGSSCPKTCYDNNYNCEHDHCIDGCHCPDGSFLHNGTCLTKSTCPCSYANREHSPRSRVRRDCNQCICANAKWVCSKNQCDGLCSVSSTHFKTFDGRAFDFDGACSYTLVRSEGMHDVSFEVQLNKNDCSDGPCGRSLSVQVNGIEARLGQKGIVRVNDKVVILPFSKDHFVVDRISEKLLKLTVSNGLSLLWDGEYRVTLRASADLGGRMRGLCGNFNRQQNDDFWTPTGDLAATAHDFGDQWAVQPCSSPVTPPSTKACNLYDFRRDEATERCSILTKAPFTECYDLVNYRRFYEYCRDDFCLHNDVKYMCNAFESYARECSKQGVVLNNWREAVPECEITCGEGKVFKECAKSCGTTCGSKDVDIECVEECVPGCVCPDNMVSDFDGECVPEDVCPCMFNDEEHEAGTTRFDDCNVCECHMGKWECTDNECGSQVECGEKEESVTCMPPYVTTCKNMHLPVSAIIYKTNKCEPGCVCIEGTVWDEEKCECVNPLSCPCHHGGRSYGEGETRKEDCNECICEAGVWACSQDPCPGHCSVYGDSHLSTFDGRKYDYQGISKYVYAKSSDTSSRKFRVEMENVKCGTMGVACSKSIKFVIGDDKTLELVRGMEIVESAGFDISYIGLWVFIRTDIGVTLQWDKGTSVMIRVEPEHSKYVEGLCGNFNGDMLDDNILRSGMETEDAKSFFVSWQLDAAIEPGAAEDTYDLERMMSEVNVHKVSWAKKKCSVITSSTFAACHDVVEHQPYYDACVFDACACDMGGDCECLCTAITAYAQECNRKGVHVYWRKQYLCPMQCDGCREYSPCLPACPKTCENFQHYEDVKAECDEVCVEGCTCPDDMIQTDDGVSCIGVEECVCKVIDGVAYRDGEKITSMSDTCRSCYCLDKDVHCLGLPCEENELPYPEMSSSFSKAIGSSATYGGFEYKPVDLTSEDCENMHVKMLEQCASVNVCAFRCDAVCQAWKMTTPQCVYAESKSACVDTCEEETCISCAAGYVLRDPRNCVRPDICPCMTVDGIVLAPGTNFDDFDKCIRYYCWNNNLHKMEMSNCKKANSDVKTQSTAIAESITNFGNDDSSLSALDNIWIDKTQYLPSTTENKQNSLSGEIMLEAAAGKTIANNNFPISEPNIQANELDRAVSEHIAIENIHIDSEIDLTFSTEETPICVDHNGWERQFGETWTKQNDACTLCTCYSSGQIRCKQADCQRYPVTESNAMVIEEKENDCCYAYRIVPVECAVATCQESEENCEYYEDLVSIPINHCCSKQQCVCNKAKCHDLGNPPCPRGKERKLIEEHSCCPIPKCVRKTTGGILDGDSKYNNAKSTSQIEIFPFDDLINEKVESNIPTAADTNTKEIDDLTHKSIGTIELKVGELSSGNNYNFVGNSESQLAAGASAATGIPSGGKGFGNFGAGLGGFKPIRSHHYPAGDFEKVTNADAFAKVSDSPQVSPGYMTKDGSQIVLSLSGEGNGSGRNTFVGGDDNLSAASKASAGLRGPYSNANKFTPKYFGEGMPHDFAELGQMPELTSAAAAAAASLDYLNKNSLSDDRFAFETLEINLGGKDDITDYPYAGGLKAGASADASSALTGTGGYPSMHPAYMNNIHRPFFPVNNGLNNGLAAAAAAGVVGSVTSDKPNFYENEGNEAIVFKIGKDSFADDHTFDQHGTAQIAAGASAATGLPSVGKGFGDFGAGLGGFTPIRSHHYPTGDFEKVTNADAFAKVSDSPQVSSGYMTKDGSQIVLSLSGEGNGSGRNKFVGGDDNMSAASKASVGLRGPFSSADKFTPKYFGEGIPHDFVELDQKQELTSAAAAAAASLDYLNKNSLSNDRFAFETLEINIGGKDDITDYPYAGGLKAGASADASSALTGTGGYPSMHPTYMNNIHRPFFPVNNGLNNVLAAAAAAGVVGSVTSGKPNFYENEGNEAIELKIGKDSFADDHTFDEHGTGKIAAGASAATGIPSGGKGFGDFGAGLGGFTPIHSHHYPAGAFEKVSNADAFAKMPDSLFSSVLKRKDESDISLTIGSKEDFLRIQKSSPEQRSRHANVASDHSSIIGRPNLGMSDFATMYNIVAPDHSPDFFGLPIKSSNLNGLCPNLADTFSCPDKCEDGYVCDGRKCVLSHDCPCRRDGFPRQPGSVWKEDDGCTNCLCMGGVVKCVAEVCSVMTCPPGQILAPSGKDSCCPSCIPDKTKCTTTSGNEYKIGDKWIDTSDSCSQCECLESGIKCGDVSCQPAYIPTCSKEEVLKETITNCCPQYKCECDASTCDPAPKCSFAHEAVIVSVDGCCPVYDCVCRPERCEVPYCSPGEKAVKTTSDTTCCPTYTCERMGCTDDEKVRRNIGEIWTPSASYCEVCECSSDEKITCRPKLGPAVKPTCASGQQPTPVRSADGCFTSYVCDCTCRGYAQSIVEMFSGQTFSKTCPCSHDLAKDSAMRSFRVYLRQKRCDEDISAGKACFKDITLTNLATGIDAVISNDFTVKIAHNIYDMNQRDSVTENGYSVTKLGSSSVVVKMMSTAVEVTYDKQSDAWEVDTPTSFAGALDGICGSCDGAAYTAGYFWIKGRQLRLPQFLKHYLIETETCDDDDTDFNADFDDTDASEGLIGVEVIAEAKAAVLGQCTDMLSGGIFDACSTVVPTDQFLSACTEVAKERGDRASCSAMAAYAQKCAIHGECVNWRTTDFCSYTCPADRIYRACGPTVEQTCDNYKSYATLGVTYSVEGCFCPSHKVLLNGACVSIFECSTCMDETKTPRRAGDQWQLATDPCIYVTCQEDGSLLQTASSCPSAPTCAKGEVIHKVVDGPCCAIYVCESINREEDCATVKCLSTGVPVCNSGEETVAVPSGPSECCFEYECVCKSHLCPYVTEPTCKEGERIVTQNPDSCCPVQVCECDEGACTESKEECPSGYVRTLSSSTRCCQTYECVCDYSWCKDEQASCLPGEIHVAHTEKEGCCTTYTCKCDTSLCPLQITSCARGYKLTVTSAEGDCCTTYACECDTSACPAHKMPKSCPTEEGYRLIPTGRIVGDIIVPSCCPIQAEEVCVCDTALCNTINVVCATYERKYQTNPGACCPTYACECDQTACAFGTITSCPTNRNLVRVEDNSCCTRLTCECNECQTPEKCQDGWEYDDVKDDCGCVVRTCIPPEACIYESVRYEPGSLWKDDICTECQCSDTANTDGKYETVCTAIKCGTCSAGYTFVPIAGECCGDCVPSMCHHGGNMFTVGQTWSSGTCSTCTCETDPVTNEVYSSCVSTSCPPLDLDCAEEDLRTTSDGCCTYCSRSPQGCEPQTDVLDYITVDGCKSTELVNVTKCAGNCNSASSFSFELNKYVNQCSCCSTATTRKIELDLVCFDESTIKHTIEVAETCACQQSICSP